MIKRPFKITVGAIQFDKFDPKDFERLCFAYYSQIKPDYKFSWFGELGKDGGRDIWGIHKTNKSKTICIQCTISKSIIKNKILHDIIKLKKNNTIPTKLIIICGGTFKNALRRLAEKEGKKIGIKTIETISGVEFEEELRQKGEKLLKRFISGQPFPDDPLQLRSEKKNKPPKKIVKIRKNFSPTIKQKIKGKEINNPVQIGEFHLHEASNYRQHPISTDEISTYISLTNRREKLDKHYKNILNDVIIPLCHTYLKYDPDDDLIHMVVIHEIGIPISNLKEFNKFESHIKNREYNGIKKALYELRNSINEYNNQMPKIKNKIVSEIEKLLPNTKDILYDSIGIFKGLLDSAIHNTKFSENSRSLISNPGKLNIRYDLTTHEGWDIAVSNFLPASFLIEETKIKIANDIENKLKQNKNITNKIKTLVKLRKPIKIKIENLIKQLKPLQDRIENGGSLKGICDVEKILMGDK